MDPTVRPLCPRTPFVPLSGSDVLVGHGSVFYLHRDNVYVRVGAWVCCLSPGSLPEAGRYGRGPKEVVSRDVRSRSIVPSLFQGPCDRPRDTPPVWDRIFSSPCHCGSLGPPAAAQRRSSQVSSPPSSAYAHVSPPRISHLSPPHLSPPHLPHLSTLHLPCPTCPLHTCPTCPLYTYPTPSVPSTPTPTPCVSSGLQKLQKEGKFHRTGFKRESFIVLPR